MTTPHETIDRVGSLLSLVCAVHCAVVPVVVLLAALGVPIASELSLFDDGRFELGFSVAAFLFVGISVALGWKTGGDRRSMFIGFGLGLAFIASSRLLPGPEWIAHLVLVAGALTVSLTHWRSLRVAHAPHDHSSPPAPAALLP